MNGAVLLLTGAVFFAAAYRFYGRYLCRLFGVEEGRKTPAHTQGDGIDYVPTRKAVLFGHHFASIAGAGPIVGPIAAAYFGWVPVVLWILFGCVFVGAMHDFASLFLSVRSGGRSIGHVIERYIGYSGRQVFLVFAWATLVLVVAVFAAIVSKTFVSDPSAATSSLLFIAMAPVFGWWVYKRGLSVLHGSLIFVPLLFGFVWVGVKVPLDLVAWFGVSAGTAGNLWLGFLFVYVFVASVLPVWLLLQPRDYLNSYLLYAMIGLGFAGVMVAAPRLQSAPFEGWVVLKAGAPSHLFPLLFVTVACGACSGFHALVASGTTAKQLNTERDIRPVGYGSMLVEGLLALMALVSVAYLTSDGATAVVAQRTPVGAFAAGLASFSARFGLNPQVGETFFTLSISAFLLTTLDTATRLARFTWQELFLPRDAQAAKPGVVRSLFGNRYLATGVVVAASAYLAMATYRTPDGAPIPAWRMIWPLFGASNQLLAALTLLVVTVVLLRRRLNFWISLVPMGFMMAVCVWALVLLMRENVGKSMVLVAATVVLLVMAMVLAVQAGASIVRARRHAAGQE